MLTLNVESINPRDVFSNETRLPISMTKNSIGSRKYARHWPSEIFHMSLIKMLLTEAAKNNPRQIVNMQCSFVNATIFFQSLFKYLRVQTANKIPNESSSNVDGRAVTPKTLKRIRYVGREMRKTINAVSNCFQDKTEKRQV